MPLLIGSQYHHLVSTPKKTFHRKKLQSDTNIDQNLVSRAARAIICSLSPDCQQPKPFSFHISTHPQENLCQSISVKPQPRNKFVCTSIARDSSCHQSHSAIFILHDRAALVSVTDIPVHFEIFFKIKLGCRGLFKAIWQKTLGALHIFDSDLHFHLSIITNTFQMVLS